MKRNRQVIVVAGILVSIIFLWLAFRTLNPESFFATLRTINPLWLVVGAVLYFAAVAVIALRWQFLLRAIRVVPLRALIPLVCIGYMGNNVYPFRAGEVLRIGLLRRQHGVPLAKGTTTVVVERVFDGIVMLSFILIALLFVPSIAPEVRTVATLAAPLFVTALGVFLLLAARPQIMRRTVAWVARLLPVRLRELVFGVSEDVIHGLEGLRSPIDLAGAVVASYTTWAIEAGVYWIVTFAFDLNLSYPTLLLVVGVVNLAGLIPASPGQIGVYEFFVQAVLVSVGVAGATALAYAIVVHIVIWLPVTLAGFYFLARMGLGWSAVTSAASAEQSSERDEEPVEREWAATSAGK